MESIDNLLQLLCGSKKLDRDRGLINLQQKVRSSQFEAGELDKLQNSFIDLLKNKESPWETKQGCLSGAKVLLPLFSNTQQFAADLKEEALRLLTDIEARVRLVAGEVLGELCKICGPEIYQSTQELIVKGIKSNLERIPLDQALPEEKAQASVLLEKISGTSLEIQQENVNNAEQIFHDTAGWKNLETWMRCLQAVVEGCGTGFLPFIDQNLLDLIFETLTHTNRFVRETGYYVCGAMVSCSSSKELQQQSSEDGEDEEKMDTSESVQPSITEGNTILQHGLQFTEHLASGLADNWSQVRLAASVATRQFLMHLPSHSARKQFYPLLLPRMCLNRYYVAEGVRLYSQETWKQVTVTQGKQKVEEYIKEVVEYYILQTDADNHAVREAACACIAELGSKIDKEKVRPFISRLLEALIVCFRDDSWPVRDAACVACGNFVFCFPEESRPSMETLFPLFYTNLEDNILSVRQGAAIALAKVVQAYGEETQTQILNKIMEGIQGLQKQASTSERYGNIEKTPANFGVVKMLRDNDMELHSDQQMYSCGSLAPKMGRGREGGCMDHKFKKPSEPWELCDGCISLLAELSPIQSVHEKISDILPSVSEACRKIDYPQHVVFLENVCKQLPVIAKNIGKRYFKPNLEAFFDPIFESLSCDNALTNAAAEQCIVDLARFLGPNILKGRVEQYKPSLMDALVTVLERSHVF